MNQQIPKQNSVPSRVMDEEKQALIGAEVKDEDSDTPSAPPAYTPRPTQLQPPSRAQPGVPPQYSGPPPPSAYPPGQYQGQQQQRVVTEVTAVPVQQEVWYSAIIPPYAQPDPNRVVIGGTALFRGGILMSTRYTYADQLPCMTSTMFVFIFLCFFLGTPLSLLCSIPAYMFISKVCQWTYVLCCLATQISNTHFLM